MSSADSSSDGEDDMTFEISADEPDILKKKFQYISGVLEILCKHRFGWPFVQPVDTVDLDIPDYLEIIKEPMDFGTIKLRLKTDFYDSFDECIKDFNQVFTNCYIYNRGRDDVVTMCQVLERIFTSKLAEMPTDGMLSDMNGIYSAHTRRVQRVPSSDVYPPCYRQQQLRARDGILCVFRTVAFLARQGIPFHGHEDEDEDDDEEEVEEKEKKEEEARNFISFLKLLADENNDIRIWLTRNKDYSSASVQNEILLRIADRVTRSVGNDVRREEPPMFAVMVDGTRDLDDHDVQNIVVSVRYVNVDLVPVEMFAGVYESPETTGENIAGFVRDALSRLRLPLEFLRGQSYDGDAYQARFYRDAQDVIRREQPLALYVDCNRRCVDTATEAALEASMDVYCAVRAVNDLAVLLSQSRKDDSKVRSAASGVYDESDQGVHRNLRPFCRSRWTVRAKAIRHVLQNYGPILEALEEDNESDYRLGYKGSSVLRSLEDGNTCVALIMAADVAEVLETLDASLQSRQITMNGMKEAVGSALKSLDVKRNSSEHFADMYERALRMRSEYDLHEIKVSSWHRRSPEKCGTGSAISPMEYFKLEYVKLVDGASAKLSDLVEQEGWARYEALERALFTGTVNEACSRYPEIDVDVLRVQLEMFRRQFEYSTVEEAANVVRSSVYEVVRLFHQVVVLLRLMLVIPVTACEDERTFRTVDRLKTRLDNTTMPRKERLNSSAVCCNVYAERVDDLRLKELVDEFVSYAQHRLVTFGNGI